MAEEASATVTDNQIQQGNDGQGTEALGQAHAPDASRTKGSVSEQLQAQALQLEAAAVPQASAADLAATAAAASQADAAGLAAAAAAQAEASQLAAATAAAAVVAGGWHSQAVEAIQMAAALGMSDGPSHAQQNPTAAPQPFHHDASIPTNSLLQQATPAGTSSGLATAGALNALIPQGVTSGDGSGGVPSIASLLAGLSQFLAQPSGATMPNNGPLVAGTGTAGVQVEQGAGLPSTVTALDSSLRPGTEPPVQPAAAGPSGQLDGEISLANPLPVPPLERVNLPIPALSQLLTNTSGSATGPLSDLAMLMQSAAPAAPAGPSLPSALLPLLGTSSAPGLSAGLGSTSPLSLLASADLAQASELLSLMLLLSSSSGTNANQQPLFNLLGTNNSVPGSSQGGVQPAASPNPLAPPTWDANSNTGDSAGNLLQQLANSFGPIGTAGSQEAGASSSMNTNLLLQQLVATLGAAPVDASGNGAGSMANLLLQQMPAPLALSGAGGSAGGMLANGLLQQLSAPYGPSDGALALMPAGGSQARRKRRGKGAEEDEDEDEEEPQQQSNVIGQRAQSAPQTVSGKHARTDAPAHARTTAEGQEEERVRKAARHDERQSKEPAGDKGHSSGKDGKRKSAHGDAQFHPNGTVHSRNAGTAEGEGAAAEKHGTQARVGFHFSGYKQLTMDTLAAPPSPLTEMRSVIGTHLHEYISTILFINKEPPLGPHLKYEPSTHCTVKRWWPKTIEFASTWMGLPQADTELLYERLRRATIKIVAYIDSERERLLKERHAGTRAV